MGTDPFSVITFHLSSDPYDELMTHLPFCRLGHGCCDRHKAPQHIEPGETKKTQHKSACWIHLFGFLFHDLNLKLACVTWTHIGFYYSLSNDHQLHLTFSLDIHSVHAVANVNAPSNVPVTSQLFSNQLCHFPSHRWHMSSGEGEQKFLFPFKVHRQTSQSIRGKPERC